MRQRKEKGERRKEKGERGKERKGERRKEKGERRKEKGGRRKEEGERRKEKGKGRRKKEKGGRRKEERGREHTFEQRKLQPHDNAQLEVVPEGEVLHSRHCGQPIMEGGKGVERDPIGYPPIHTQI
jgi:hypothetical protein